MPQDRYPNSGNYQHNNSVYPKQANPRRTASADDLLWNGYQDSERDESGYQANVNKPYEGTLV